MNSRGRYILAVFIFAIALHSILSLTHDAYARATSSLFTPSADRNPPYAAPPSDMSASDLHSSVEDPMHLVIPQKYYLKNAADAELYPTPRADATLVMLARDMDMETVIRSVRRLEDRFNKHHRYPWVFLNERPFSNEFKERVSMLTDAVVEFGIIPHDDWFQPDWIDEKKATANRKELWKQGIVYGESVTWRNMCRFHSGFFYRHPLLQKYRWYWRVETDVQFNCDIVEDPFRFMETNNKAYGFTIALEEIRETVEDLWKTTKDFIKEYPHFVANDNALGFVSDDGGVSYNMCHFWSNFEIADMEFFRGEAYQTYFDFLDKNGGFYYSRWGDAPVHSIAASLFLPKDRIHFFNEIGYSHGSITHCPRGAQTWKAARCDCKRGDTFDYQGFSCLHKWDRVHVEGPHP